MADRLTPERRSENMRHIRAQNTTPELRVRQMLHGMGYRFRIHVSSLPGKPDIAFTARKKIIFIHGCFWHQHDSDACRNGRKPKSNTDYWSPKLARNVERDRQHIEQLRALGWGVMTVWECEMKDREALTEQLTAFLGSVRYRLYGK